MPTDDERCEVAARLRGPFDVIGQGGYVSLNGTLFGMQLLANSENELRAGVRRLADLIEPSDGQNERDVSDGLDCETRVDRDALLKLADEIEYGAGTDDGEYDDMPGFMVAAIARQEIAYARRIREALGVKL